jgi:hypothetical protein
VIGRKAKAVAALAAALSIAALASSCGGGSGSERGTTTAEPATANAGVPAGTTTSKSEEAPKASEGAGRAKVHVLNVSTGPLRLTGGGSRRYRYPGDYNVIQDYGHEGAKPAFAGAARAVHGFFAARAKRNWPAACSYLSESMLTELETLSTHYKSLEGKSCSETVGFFAGKVPKSEAYEASEVDARSLRVDHQHGFLIFFSGGEAVRTSVGFEDGKWLVSSTFATPLRPGGAPKR